MEYVFFILLGVAIFVFGYVMGLVCASKKRRNELGVAIFVFGYVMGLVCASKKRRNEPCVTMQDIIDREG